jgi:hypothetical protein
MPQDRVRNHKLRNRRAGQTTPLRVTIKRAALGGALGALVVCANMAAARAGDDNNAGDEPFTTKVMRTLGLKDPAALGKGIDYSARSPLVVPPTRDLPPPVASAPPAVPNWPKDPDEVQRAKKKADDNKRFNYDYASEANRPLRPSELNVPGNRDADAPTAIATDDQGNPTTQKKSFFNFDWAKKEQYATFTGEPARDNLTDPPPGYRTPSADQPYGIGKERSTYKIPTLSDREELQR